MNTDRGYTSNFQIFQGLDYFGRSQPFNPDYESLPYCECGESFLSWCREHIPPHTLEHPTIRTLDEAILAITLEYADRLQSLPAHPLNSCVPEIFQQVLRILTQKRWDLLRNPKNANNANVYVGQEQFAQDGNSV